MKFDRIDHLRRFLLALRDERANGHRYAALLLAIPTHRWEGVIQAHPEWIRAGTIEALLEAVSRLLPCDAERARAVAAFAARHSKSVTAPPDIAFFVATIRAEAHIALAAALLALNDVTAAFNAASVAGEFLAGAPAATIERADANFIRAQALGRAHQPELALLVVDECLEVYTDHGVTERCSGVAAARAGLISEMDQAEPA